MTTGTVHIGKCHTYRFNDGQIACSLCGKPELHESHLGFYPGQTDPLTAFTKRSQGERMSDDFSFEIPPGWEEKEAAPEPERFVPRELRLKAAIYEERNKIYGDNYKLFGSVIRAMFPEGLNLESEEDHNRWGVFVQIMAKVTRYAANFHRGGHDDSLDDLSVYSMMLKELDAELRK